MNKKILLPLDGSKISEEALPYVIELAGKLVADVVLYHVHRNETPEQEHIDQIYLEVITSMIERNTRHILPEGSEIQITTKMENGEAASNICNLVDTDKLDMIIMTAASSSGLKIGKMIGSVADHVCRTVSVPVMLIRPGNVRQNIEAGSLITHILVPLDGSEISKSALPVAEELATKSKAKITLFRMATELIPFYDSATYGMVIDYARYDEVANNLAVAEMAVLEKELKTSGIDATSVVGSGYDAAYQILEISKKMNIDLVVMTTHGRSGLGRWLLGNVAERVLRHSEVPLLLVHARAR